MAIDFHELTESAEIGVGTDGVRIPFKWVAVGSNDTFAVEQAAYLGTPAVTPNGLVRDEITVSPRGGGICFVGVSYSSKLPQTEAVGDTPADTPDTPTDEDDLGAEWSFSTKGGTAHVTQSLETKEKVKVGGVAADNKRAIGLRKDGVDGCDILTSQLKFSITVTRPNVRLPFVRTLGKITGRTNKSAWRGFKAGELLYEGCDGSGTSYGRAKLTHSFIAGENLETGDARLTVATGLTLNAKKAHEYVWVAYSDQVTGDQLYPLPLGVYRERVYEEGEFTALELGG